MGKRKRKQKTTCTHPRNDRKRVASRSWCVAGQNTVIRIEMCISCGWYKRISDGPRNGRLESDWRPPPVPDLY